MALQTRLNFRRFRCEKTTEAGEDEVYMLVVRTTSEGGYTAYRIPGGNGHWSLNDGNDPREVGRTIIHQIDLDDNEKTNIYVRIMEEDQGLPGDWAQKIGDALTASGNDIAEAIGTTLQVIGGVFNAVGLQDTDDYIGAFGVEYAFKNGSLVDIHWERGGNVYSTDTDNPALGQHSSIIRFNGDGSDYVGEFYVDVI